MTHLEMLTLTRSVFLAVLSVCVCGVSALQYVSARVHACTQRPEGIRCLVL